MAAHVKRIICKAMRQIIENTTARPNERLRAARLLYKVRYSAAKGKPRGRRARKIRITSRLDDILSGVE
jgi:hypothetical protein